MGERGNRNDGGLPFFQDPGRFGECFTQEGLPEVAVEGGEVMEVNDFLPESAIFFVKQGQKGVAEAIAGEGEVLVGRIF